MQVYCTRCGHQFQVASQGPVYCPSCGVLLGPAPANSAGEQATRGPDPASGVPGFAPPGYVPPNYGPPGYGVTGYGYPGLPTVPIPAPAPSTVPLPPSSYPSLAGAASSPYGYSPALAAAATVAAKADRHLRRRTRALRASLIVLAVLLVLGAGAGLVTYERQRQIAQGSASPTPAIRVPGGFIEYSDPAGVFACGVPSGWEQVSSSSSALTLAEFGDPSQQTTVSIQYSQDSTLDEIGSDDQVLQNLSGSYSGGKLSGKTHARNNSFGGDTWAEEEATLKYTGSDGTATTLRVRVLSAVHDVTTGNISSPYLVSIIEVAPSASFDTADTNDFQVVQSSFVFLP
jgi:hypothetical protein